MDTATASVTVNEKANQLPVAKATATPATIVMLPGQVAKTTLDSAGSTDPDGDIKSVLWALPVGTAGVNILSPATAKTDVEFTKAGIYTFTLTVTDNGGKADAANVSVIVNQQTVPQKTCAPLNDIISDFSKLDNADTPDNFKIFIRLYKEFREITAFYKLMETAGLPGQPVNNQIKFFIDQKIESRLVSWIENLRVLIQENKDIRLLTLLMLNMHTELAYYISCIQKEDIDKANVKMLDAESTLASILKVIQPLVQSFTVAQTKVLAQLLTVTNAERTRVKNNNEESVKAKYVSLLNTILVLLR